jgi:hypothetical protein
LADPKRASAYSERVGVVEDDDLVVRSQPQVAFDARAELDPGGDSDQAVLGEFRAMVQAAVSKPARPRVEWIRP